MKVLSLVALSILLSSCASEPLWQRPTESPASVPSFDERFSEYITQTKNKIHDTVSQRFTDNTPSPYLGNYSVNDVVEMRSPFQIPDDGVLCQGKGSNMGFLLIHGLTDSPFLMRDIANSLHQQYPCALIRAVLLPGHGTFAGDSRDMKHEDWLKITEYGVQSFNEYPQITDLYIAGFSTGTSLAIRHLGDSQYTEKIKALLLFSTAIKAHTHFAFLTPGLRHIKTWVDLQAERDAARYESFSMNAGAEFYTLVKDLESSKYTVTIPVFMAVSADDTTIDAQASADFFCNNVDNDNKTMLWYQSEKTQLTAPQCSTVQIVNTGNIQKEFAGENYLFGNYSHLSLTISPDNAHYGLKGAYHNCNAYSGDDFNACQSQDNKALFGESNIKNKDFQEIEPWKYLRRGTFNPHYKEMTQAVTHFIEQLEQ